MPWAWRNKQSIFAPGDLRKDVHINHPACTCPKNQPQSPVSSRLGSRCRWGSPSSSNRCARGHSEPRWHRCCQRRKMEITFPSFPILLPKQPVYMHFRAPLIRFANDWPHTGSLRRRTLLLCASLCSFIAFSFFLFSCFKLFFKVFLRRSKNSLELQPECSGFYSLQTLHTHAVTLHFDLPAP